MCIDSSLTRPPTTRLRFAAMARLHVCVLICLLVLVQPLVHANYFPVLLRHNSHYLHTAPSPLDADPAPTHTITLPLDHHSPAAHPTFQLRYWVNDTLYKRGSGAPLFFALGGEGSESPAAVSARSGLAWYAAQFGALMVAAEHRFYGQSVPGSDVSVPNLHYLTSEQALADFATLITNLTTTLQLPPTTPVIAFGGSYSGSLSAWLHLKYPTIVHGSLASSAPVQAQVDFPEYLDTVQRSLGPQCTSLVANATRLIETLLATPAQRAYLARVFNVCEGAIEGELERSMLFNNILGPITALVQYNTNYRPINITTACRYMSDVAAESNALTALVRFNEWYNTAENGTYPFAMGGECQNVSYSGYLQYMQADSAERQWYWQTCNEFGFYQTAENRTGLQPTAFSARYINLPFYLRQCHDLYNTTADVVARNVQRTIDTYGGWHVSTNRTIFSNGLIDPWHTKSVYNESLLSPPPPSAAEPLNLVNVIGPTSHCQDLGVPRMTDIWQLRAGRFRNVNQISLWLKGGGLPSSSTASPPPPPPVDSSSSSSSGGYESSTGGGMSSDSSISPPTVASSSSSSSTSGGSNSTTNSSSSSSGGSNGGGGNDSRRSSMSSGAVVGIVVFCMLVGVVGIAAAVWWYRKRKVTLGGGGVGGVGYHEDGLTTGYSSLLGSDARTVS